MKTPRAITSRSILVNLTNEAISSLPEFIAERFTTDKVDGSTLMRNIDKLQTCLMSN